MPSSFLQKVKGYKLSLYKIKRPTMHGQYLTMEHNQNDRGLQEDATKQISQLLV